jgi:CHASE2 domain-containing sensor protein
VTSDQILESELERFQGRVEKGSGRFWSSFRRSRVALIVLALSCAFMRLRGLPEEFSNTTLDAAAILQKPAEPAHVSLVTIDDQDYRDLFGASSPLNPEQLAELIDAIFRGNPSLIVVDLDTSHAMFRTMRAPAAARIVWAVSNKNEANKVFEPEPALGGAPMPGNWSSALDSIPIDGHGVVRSYVRRFALKGGGYFPSLEFAPVLAQAKRPLPTDPIDADENTRLLDFRYKFFPMPARALIDKSHLPGWPKGDLHNQVVVLGGTYRAARNNYATPTRLMEGSEIVAQGIEAEMSDTGIQRANPWFAGLLQLLAGFGFVALYHFFRLRTALLTSLVCIPLLSVAASLILFHRLAMWGALIPVLAAILVAELYTKASLYLSLCVKFKELRQKSPGEIPPVKAT